MKPILQCVRTQMTVTQTGGSATRVHGWSAPRFGLNERAKEVVWLKRIAVQLSLSVSGAAYAAQMRLFLVRSRAKLDQGSVNTMFIDDCPRDNLVWGGYSVETDSFAQVSERFLANPKTDMEWPEGQEPPFLVGGDLLGLELAPNLNPATILVLANAFWWFWIDTPTEEEYQKLSWRFRSMK